MTTEIAVTEEEYDRRTLLHALNFAIREYRYVASTHGVEQSRRGRTARRWIARLKQAKAEIAKKR